MFKSQPYHLLVNFLLPFYNSVFSSPRWGYNNITYLTVIAGPRVMTLYVGHHYFYQQLYIIFNLESQHCRIARKLADNLLECHAHFRNSLYKNLIHKDLTLFNNDREASSKLHHFLTGGCYYSRVMQTRGKSWPDSLSWE